MANFSPPRILLYCDRRAWAYHTTATQLVRHLCGRYDFDIVFAEDTPAFDEAEYALVYVFWWAERRHRAYVGNRSKVVKEISSHRWQQQQEFGLLSPHEADERWMNDAGSLVATSERLETAFKQVGKPVFRYALGVDPEIFAPTTRQHQRLVVGWAGNPNDPAKRFDEMLQPACRDDFQLKVADGTIAWKDMAGFYRAIDVIAITSSGEGTPLPLLEAMACGCFPVTTDVGVAPEIVIHGQNGLIIEHSVEALRDALHWCSANLDKIREAGTKNADFIRKHRTWRRSAEQFSKIIDAVIMQNRTIPPESSTQASGHLRDSYVRHFERINPEGLSESAYGNSVPYYKQDIELLLPNNRDAKILEVGTGYGHFLRFLAHLGYTRIFGIDICEPLLKEVLKRSTHLVERLDVADALEYLPRQKNQFDCIVMLDVVEHFCLEDARTLLLAAAASLREGGRLILRTPNMANILGGYSLYMDLTHRHGYTEWSLIHLLEQCSLPGAHLHVPVQFGSAKRKYMAAANTAIHKLFYRLNGRAEPKWFGKNIVVYVDKLPAASQAL